MQSLQVSILGQKFHLRSDAPPEQAQRIAAFVESQIHEVTASGRVTGTLPATVLALLNLSAKYLQQGEAEAEALAPDATRRLQQLVGRIEQALAAAVEQTP